MRKLAWHEWLSAFCLGGGCLEVLVLVLFVSHLRVEPILLSLGVRRLLARCRVYVGCALTRYVCV